MTGGLKIEGKFSLLLLQCICCVNYSIVVEDNSTT